MHTATWPVCALFCAQCSWHIYTDHGRSLDINEDVEQQHTVRCQVGPQFVHIQMAVLSSVGLGLLSLCAVYKLLESDSFESWCTAVLLHILGTNEVSINEMVCLFVKKERTCVINISFVLSVNAVVSVLVPYVAAQNVNFESYYGHYVSMVIFPQDLLSEWYCLLFVLDLLNQLATADGSNTRDDDSETTEQHSAPSSPTASRRGSRSADCQEIQPKYSQEQLEAVRKWASWQPAIDHTSLCCFAVF